MRISNAEHMRRIGDIGRPSAIEAMHKKRDENISNYNTSPKLCRKCNLPLDYNHRRNIFCSKSCSAKYNNLGSRKHGQSPRRCTECGKRIYSKNDTQQKCRSCSSGDRRVNRIIKLEQKMINLAESKIDGDDLKIYLVYKRGHKCEKCQNTVWNEKSIPLEGHHTNGNYLNNHPDNLKLLCPNCHSQTDTYAGKNKHNSKRYRYKRLRDKGL